ncbi:MAG: hypothetical protein WDN44_07175 [Sphingomonas sp.]
MDTILPDSALTRDQVIERNLRVVEAHFHNENPDDVEEAIALYADNISWEAPTRGVVMDKHDEILEAYRGIFRTVAYRKVIPLRRFATERFVFDDQIGHVTLGRRRDAQPALSGGQPICACGSPMSSR